MCLSNLKTAPNPTYPWFFCHSIKVEFDEPSLRRDPTQWIWDSRENQNETWPFGVVVGGPRPEEFLSFIHLSFFILPSRLEAQLFPSSWVWFWAISALDKRLYGWIFVDSFPSIWTKGKRYGIDTRFYWGLIFWMVCSSSWGWFHLH